MNTPMFDFDEGVLAAVIGHMNDEHRHDSLAIVKALGGVIDAVEASITRLSGQGVTFEVRTPTSSVEETVPWDEVPVTRADIRHELVRMTEASRG